MPVSHRTHKHAFLCGTVLACLLVLSPYASSQPDFTGMSDVKVMLYMHSEDSVTGLAEFRRRSKDYSRAQIRAIEQEFNRQLMLPRDKPTPTVEGLLETVNATTKITRRLDAFSALYERYMAADTPEKDAIRKAFLDSWASVTYSPRRADEREDAYLDRRRFRGYAHELGYYVQTEAELISILKARYLDSGMARGEQEFLNALAYAKVPLGSLAAAEVERLYADMIESLRPSGGIGNCETITMSSQIHQVLGRSGRPGLEALLRMGTESREEGIWALGSNTTPEAEAMLWDMYETTPANHDRRRIELLRALSGKRGTASDQEARRARIRAALVPYLQLPAGEVNLWNMERAVALAKDTRDPYYLPHVTELEVALRQLGEDQFDPTGSDLSVEERRVALYIHLDEATAKLRDAKPLD
ncbi:MAG: hypothetical protein L3K26_17740 [Candidatus Hydrogenedentes bacterium]|nr:hypothetical protein [Candidatus Hydrogenedentota bacterium]